MTDTRRDADEAAPSAPPLPPTPPASLPNEWAMHHAQQLPPLPRAYAPMPCAPSTSDHGLAMWSPKEQLFPPCQVHAEDQRSSRRAVSAGGALPAGRAGGCGATAAAAMLPRSAAHHRRQASCALGEAPSPSVAILIPSESQLVGPCGLYTLHSGVSYGNQPTAAGPMEKPQGLQGRASTDNMGPAATPVAGSSRVSGSGSGADAAAGSETAGVSAVPDGPGDAATAAAPGGGEVVAGSAAPSHGQGPGQRARSSSGNEDAALRQRLPGVVKRRLAREFGERRTRDIRSWGQLAAWLVPEGHGRYWAVWTLAYSCTALSCFFFMAGQYQAYLISEQPTGSMVWAQNIQAISTGPPSLVPWITFWQSWSASSPSNTFNGDFLLLWGGKFNPAIATGEWYRWMTSMLVHQSFNHILSNLVLFLLLCSYLEHHYGTLHVFAVFFVSGVAGNFSSTMFEDRCVLVVGSSGAIFGLTGMFIADVLLNFETMFLPWARLGGMIALLVFLVVMQVTDSTMSGAISYASHIGGGITGFVLALLLLPNLKDRRWSALEKLSARINVTSQFRAMAEKARSSTSLQQQERQQDGGQWEAGQRRQETWEEREGGAGGELVGKAEEGGEEEGVKQGTGEEGKRLVKGAGGAAGRQGHMRDRDSAQQRSTEEYLPAVVPTRSSSSGLGGDAQMGDALQQLLGSLHAATPPAPAPPSLLSRRYGAQPSTHPTSGAGVVPPPRPPPSWDAVQPMLPADAAGAGSAGGAALPSAQTQEWRSYGRTATSIGCGPGFSLATGCNGSSGGGAPPPPTASSAQSSDFLHSSGGNAASAGLRPGGHGRSGGGAAGSQQQQVLRRSATGELRPDGPPESPWSHAPRGRDSAYQGGFSARAAAAAHAQAPPLGAPGPAAQPAWGEGPSEHPIVPAPADAADPLAIVIDPDTGVRLPQPSLRCTRRSSDGPHVPVVPFGGVSGGPGAEYEEARVLQTAYDEALAARRQTSGREGSGDGRDATVLVGGVAGSRGRARGEDRGRRRRRAKAGRRGGAVEAEAGGTASEASQRAATRGGEEAPAATRHGWRQAALAVCGLAGGTGGSWCRRYPWVWYAVMVTCVVYLLLALLAQPLYIYLQVLPSLECPV